MINRIVKMEFQLNKVDEFKKKFKKYYNIISSQPGCQKIELLQDLNQKNLFFTYSIWKSEKDLELYRQSETFKHIWKETKILFSQKPYAWSIKKIHNFE